MAEIAARGGGPTVLEAAPEVAGFYRALGFADTAHEVDPDGDELVVQRRDLPPDPGTAEARGERHSRTVTEPLPRGGIR